MKRKSEKTRASKVLPGQLDLFAEIRSGEASVNRSPSSEQENISERILVSPTSPSVASCARPKQAKARRPGIKSDKIECRSIKEDEALLDTREAARLLKIGVSTLEKMRGQKKGPRFLKLTNSTVRYKIADLEAWMEARARSLPADQ